MILEVKNPVVDLDAITDRERPDGISGFIRAKNEGEYIYQVIESWLELVDELIVVFNDCDDNTEEEVLRACNDFRGKVFAYKYLPRVYPQGSEMHIKLPPDSVNSLVNYYNYSLSKTTRKYAVKIDGDIILDVSLVPELKCKLQSIDIDNGYYKLQGINLIDNKGQLYVPSNSKFCGLNGDLCVFRVQRETIFRWRPEFEYLDLSGLNCLGGAYYYYHMKFVKSDMGISNYQLKVNKDSRYVEISKRFLVGLKFIPVCNILKAYDINMRTPQSIGLLPIKKRNFIQDYEVLLQSSGIDYSFSIPMYLSNKRYSIVLYFKSRLKKLLGI